MVDKRKEEFKTIATDETDYSLKEVLKNIILCYVISHIDTC